jgi:CysZ protein
MTSLLLPLTRAIRQLDDRVLLGVLAQTVAWSVGCFALLHAGTIWAVHRLLDLHGWAAFMADIAGSVGASMLALWLFVPVAAAIGTLFFDRIAAAVERRWYPDLAPAAGASLSAQLWDGAVLVLRILLLNLIGLLLALILPGIGLVFGWLISGYAIGRGLFVAVAMRRMARPAAESLYRACRPMVLAQGAVLAAGAYLPFVNLLLPVVGTAAMVHVLDLALSRFVPRSDVAWRP